MVSHGDRPSSPLDSESEVWMMIGIAVRMSIDIGLHVVSLLLWSMSAAEVLGLLHVCHI